MIDIHERTTDNVNDVIGPGDETSGPKPVVLETGIIVAIVLGILLLIVVIVLVVLIVHRIGSPPTKTTNDYGTDETKLENNESIRNTNHYDYASEICEPTYDEIGPEYIELEDTPGQRILPEDTNGMRRKNEDEPGAKIRQKITPGNIKELHYDYAINEDTCTTRATENKGLNHSESGRSGTPVNTPQYLVLDEVLPDSQTDSILSGAAEYHVLEEQLKESVGDGNNQTVHAEETSESGVPSYFTLEPPADGTNETIHQTTGKRESLPSNDSPEYYGLERTDHREADVSSGPEYHTLENSIDTQSTDDNERAGERDHYTPLQVIQRPLYESLTNKVNEGTPDMSN
uniref:Uncharacterized protein LOC102809620 n=1 Tax=Saccoglossus kowalevskii TaxID=10224 RepID=A0ABM0MSV2_SACKO|nr:PREDICTED: uncharacterized protein LOC102809620 [Saccoglossus kowalevskii]